MESESALPRAPSLHGPGRSGRDSVLGSCSRHRRTGLVLPAIWETAGKAAEAPEVVRDKARYGEVALPVQRGQSARLALDSTLGKGQWHGVVSKYRVIEAPSLTPTRGSRTTHLCDL